MTERSRRLVLGLAGAQLFLVTLGVLGVQLRRLGPLGIYLDDYSVLSGADADYGFFAPSVNSQIETRFEVVDREGRRTPAEIDAGANREARLAVDNITDTFENLDPAMHRPLAASLAGKIFAAHPEAVEVVVRVERFETISPEEYRLGARPRRTPFYEATFTHEIRRAGEKPDATVNP